MNKADTANPVIQGGYRVIFRAWYTDKDGNRVYAKTFGKRCWPIRVPIGKK